MADNRNFVNKFANQGGGDIFVEDAKLSEISTKSAIASEGVMLKGTDGAYYEIDKTSLSEVIRAELGAILADNSKNNGTSVGKVPTLNSSGNALGSSSVADLASVLGVLVYKEEITPSMDLTTLGKGIYNCGQGNSRDLSGHPRSGNVSPFVFISVDASSYKFQFICYIFDGAVYSRGYGSSTWSTWKEL